MSNKDKKLNHLQLRKHLINRLYLLRKKYQCFFSIAIEQDITAIEDILSTKLQTYQLDDITYWEQEVLGLESAIHDHIIEQFIDSQYRSNKADSQYRSNKAFLEITAGSGGTDAQLCVDLLWTMYKGWIDQRSGFWRIENRSALSIGTRHLTVSVEGRYLYAMLAQEQGIHRIVRKSPMNTKRHTSFVSVVAYPPSVENKQTLMTSDLIIERKKSSGSGGQHTNTTDSAVRIKHIPTGLIAQSQTTRCQHKNKELAIRQLEAKIKNLAKSNSTKEQLDPVASGYQIRSYILDKNVIIDHRSNHRSSDVKRILQGDIDDFMYAHIMTLSKNTSK